MTAEPFPTQVAVLCGGSGTRLGDLTKAAPKPLLPVGDQPFLAHLLSEVKRFGFMRVLLLAAFHAEQVNAFAKEFAGRLGITIDVAVEPERAGTGGALWHARDRLDPIFLLLNGDSWFDIDLIEFGRAALAGSAAVTLALNRLDDASRYGTVGLEGVTVTSFAARPDSAGAGLVNGGVYIVRREIVDIIGARASLEEDVLPALVRAGRVEGCVGQGFFIDIGVPVSLAAAQASVPARRRRPAAFLDRDGVLNRDLGYVGTAERFEWLPGSVEAVRDLNRAGYYVFVVTNQAGVARGFYTVEDVRVLSAHMSAELRAAGAHIDDYRFCPHHLEGTVPEFTRACDWRKPGAGMIHDLLAHWPVDLARSFLVGDKQSDLAAGRLAGLDVHLCGEGGLAEILPAAMAGGQAARL